GQANGTPLIITDCGTDNFQTFRMSDNVLRGVVDGQIEGPAAGKCIDVSGGNPTNGTPVIVFDCKDPNSGTSQNQRWQLLGVTVAAEHGPPFHIKTTLGGKCLDVFQANPANGTPVIIFDCHEGTNQQWAVIPGLGGFAIVGLANKCLSPRN